MRALLVCVVLAGCVQANAVTCEDGRTCPADTACDEVHALCVVPEQLTSCDGLAEGMACSGGGVDGTCRDGVCLASLCGDGIASTTEQCDGVDMKGITDCIGAGFYEGGAITCTPQCTYDVRDCARRCGDGQLDPEEQCEVGDLGVIKGAPATCLGLGFYKEPGLACNPGLCTYDTTACEGRCGDGVINGDELCEGAAPAKTCVDLGFDRGHADCSALCAADTTGCDTLGWQRAPSFTGIEKLGAVFGTSATDINALGWYFFVGNIGGPGWWHYDGTTWTKRPMTGLMPPPGGLAEGNYVINDGTGWAGGQMIAAGYYWDSSNYIPMSIHYDGTTWTSRTVPTTNSGLQLNGVWGSAGNDVYAAIGNPNQDGGGEVMHWNGSTWTSETVASHALLSVWGTGAHVYAVGNNGTLLHKNSTWSSIDVSSLTTAHLNAVWGTSSDNVFVVGEGGTILHYNSELLQWETMQSPTTKRLTFVWGLGPNEVYAGGGGGTILRFDGSEWRLMTNASPGLVLDMWGTSKADLHAVGAAEILHYEGDGFERPAPSPFPEPNYTSLAAAGQDLYVGGKTIYLLDRFTGTWTDTQMPPMSYGPVQELWSSSTFDLYAAAGDLQHYDGDTWATITLPGATGEADGVWGSSSTNVYVVGGSGKIWHHTGSNPTTNWALEPSGTTVYLDGVWGSGPTDVFAVGNGTILHSTGNGTWAPMQTLGEYLLSIHGTAPNDVFAVGFNGAIVHYDGTAWTPMDSGVPGQTLYRVHAVAPDDVFAVGPFGLLLHYDGALWSPVRTPTNADLSCVWGSPSGTVYVTGAGPTFLALQRHAPW